MKYAVALLGAIIVTAIVFGACAFIANSFVEGRSGLYQTCGYGLSGAFAILAGWSSYQASRRY